MTLQAIPGAGAWYPPIPNGIAAGIFTSTDVLLDADEEEYQWIGSITIEGGGTKTFGGGSTKIDWTTGGAIAFVSSATLRIGAKQSSKIDFTAGPAARATVGQSAFDAYTDLIGGTDTITSTAARSDAINSGTPFSVSDGDLIAICFHLDVVSGTQSVKVRSVAMASGAGFPCSTLVTSSGTVFANQSAICNLMITFSDGTLGWLTPSLPFSVIDTASSTIGNGNIKANIFRLPFPFRVDAIFGLMNVAGNFAFELYSDPLGTPSLIEAMQCDANVVGATSVRPFTRKFTTNRTLSANTDYAFGVKQTSATAMTVQQRDVADVLHWKMWGMGPACYGATSTGGAAFVPDNSGKRRYSFHLMANAFDDGVGGGGAAGMKQSFMNANFSG